jgi:hypothetical protein
MASGQGQRANFSSWSLAARMIFAFWALFFFSEESRVYEKVNGRKVLFYPTFHLVDQEGENAVIQLD